MLSAEYCYLSTTGRKSGRAHTVELWFAASPDGRSLYILAGGGYRSDWVRNIEHDSCVQVRVGELTTSARGRILSEEQEALLARRLVVRKYYQREYDPSGEWEATALPVAIDLDG